MRKLHTLYAIVFAAIGWVLWREPRHCSL